MKYSISLENPAQHLFKIRTEIESTGGITVILELPRWRPGRYELAAYPPKISDAAAFDFSGRAIPFTRINAHTWEVGPLPDGKGYFEHSFYAVEKNAGSSFLDDSLIYINPLNLLLFTKEKINEACELQIAIPDGYQTATSLKRKGNTFFAKDFHELADSPILASKDLLHLKYSVNKIPFHLWFWGDVKLDEKKVIDQFTSFTQKQIDLFGGFPVDEYHFLFLILPNPFHHGVEHCASTVIVMGPGYNMNDGLKYDDFLGISSHELFHTWNVKSIRPFEMQPYDYSKEIYSFQHYITEGVTTYYGDLILFRCGIWNTNEYLREFHDSNPGRHYVTAGDQNVSLRQASFESWINGYSEGVPNKKISFYSKGAMVAFMLDQHILEESKNKYCLDHVMREMYKRFGTTGIGYTENDFWKIVAQFSGSSTDSFYKKYVDGTEPLEEGMKKAAKRLGLSWELTPGMYQSTLGKFGFAWQSVAGKCIVTNVMPGSPASKAGIAKDDEIIALAGRKVENNLNEISNFIRENTETDIHFFNALKLKAGKITPENNPKTPLFALKTLPSPNEKQKENFAIWEKGIA